MTGFVNHAHAALTESLFQLITTVEDRLAGNRGGRFRGVVGTINDIIRETGTTGWTFFHPMVLKLRGHRASRDIREDFSGSTEVKQDKYSVLIDTRPSRLLVVEL